MNKYYILLAGLIMLAFSSCEDPIEIDNGFETPTFVVDAWITNEPNKEQTIILTQSQDYFDNRLPTPIENAVVSVNNGSNVFTFEYQADGRYTYTNGAEGIGNIGDEFTLSILADDKEYSSTTSLNPTAIIDSISVFFEDQVVGGDDGLYAELYARDLPGQGNTYWVKSYKNDTLLNKPEEINVIYDSTFDPGTALDGITFIRPLRFAINPVDDDGIFIDWLEGEKIYCEVHSISNEAFTFMQTTLEQTTNGNNGIFTLPIANAESNVSHVNGDDNVLGIFNVAEVASIEKIVGQ